MIILLIIALFTLYMGILVLPYSYELTNIFGCIAFPCVGVMAILYNDLKARFEALERKVYQERNRK